VSLADEYARSRATSAGTSVIPISGASEGFVPEDAEILIEGTETGTTLRANRLHHDRCDHGVHELRHRRRSRPRAGAASCARVRLPAGAGRRGAAEKE
jgi:hypothetical protein